MGVPRAEITTQKAETLNEKKSGEQLRQNGLLRGAESTMREQLAKLSPEMRKQLERGRRQAQSRNQSSWGRELSAQMKQLSPTPISRRRR